MIEKIFLFFRDVFFIVSIICFGFSAFDALFYNNIQVLECCFVTAVLTGLIGLLLNYIYENI